MSTSLLSQETLRELLTGDVFQPGDEGYAQSHFSWNLTTVHEPAMVVMAETAADVQVTLLYTQEHGYKVAVQSTGHGQPRCCRDGILINTARMQKVEIDPTNRTARIQAGCQWKDVLPLAQEHGLAALSGSAPHVGVVGYMLGAQAKPAHTGAAP